MYPRLWGCTENSSGHTEGIIEVFHLEEILGITESNSLDLELRKLRLSKGKGLPQEQWPLTSSWRSTSVIKHIALSSSPTGGPGLWTLGTALLSDPALYHRSCDQMQAIPKQPLWGPPWYELDNSWGHRLVLVIAKGWVWEICIWILQLGQVTKSLYSQSRILEIRTQNLPDKPFSGSHPHDSVWRAPKAERVWKIEVLFPNFS